MPLSSKQNPPQMKKQKYSFEIHDTKIEDPYFWFKDKELPEVTEHLHSENAYTESVLSQYKEVENKIFSELKARVKDEDQSYPIKRDSYYYYSKDIAGKEHKVYVRKKDSLENNEETILDVNQLAADHDYLKVGVLSVSPNHKWLAYSTDTDGSEQFSLYFKNLETGEVLPQHIEGTYYSFAWANDSSCFYYNVLDKNMRPTKVYRSNIKDLLSQELFYEEKSSEYFVSLQKSRSDKFIYINIHGAITTEMRYVDAGADNAKLILFAPRKKDVEYYLDDNGKDLFYVHTNENAKNFKLLTCPIANTSEDNWKELIAHNSEIYLSHIDPFKNHLVIFEREEGLEYLRVLNLANNSSQRVEMPESNYHIGDYSNPNFASDSYLFYYTSLITPASVFECDMKSLTVHKRKTKEVPTYDINNYVTERRMAESHDGALVPISILYKKGTPLDGSAPCYLYGYGSYGINMSPGFRSNIFSLVDRGFVFAVANIRGGSEKGRQWYEDGKFLKKKNTFKDFIASAESLIQWNYTKAQNIVICGGSAGGLLVGAVVNMRPDLFKAVVAHVPFVDVVNTMLDDNLPLTTIEYDEWGNPKDKSYFDYILSYSPYDNVEAKDYPHMFITAGLNDPRVTYWEPAKWTAKLREVKTDKNLVLLKTNMDAGHAGKSGRYESLREYAEEYTFILAAFEMI